MFKLGDKVLFTDTDGENRVALVHTLGVVNWEGRPSVEIWTADERLITRPITKLSRVP